jgi:double-stranded uracil-DNA glycosylase
MGIAHRGDLGQAHASANPVTPCIGAGHNPRMPSPPTLRDLLRIELEVVFVGINPSLYSAQQGHYFARPTNRFWPAFSRSALSKGARRALGVESLTPQHDALLPSLGFGFTDMVKRPTARAQQLTRAEFAAGAARLLTKLERFRPRIACFHGVTGFRPLATALGADPAAVALGVQELRIGATRLFVAPNPSPANAHFTPAQQTEWYDRLARLLAEGA